MTLLNQELRSVNPDLRDVPLDQLAELGDSVLPLLQAEDYTWEIIDCTGSKVTADVSRQWINAGIRYGQPHAWGIRQRSGIARE